MLSYCTYKVAECTIEVLLERYRNNNENNANFQESNDNSANSQTVLDRDVSTSPICRRQVENEVCPICLEELGLVRVLQCEHSFHPNCIKIWISKTPTCPVCRRKC